MRTFFKFTKVMRQIASLGCDRQTKRALQWFYVALKMRRYLGPINGTIGLPRFKVKFCHAEPTTYLFQEVFLDNEYFFRCDRRTPYIIDCGSNIGIALLYFKLRYPEATVLAFEPDGLAFECLSENVRANGLKSVVLVNKAVSLRDGRIPFYTDVSKPGSLVMSTVSGRAAYNKSQDVEAVRLSSYIDRDVDFLKLDVEGAELDVMEDLRESGKLRFISQMVIEYHHHITADHDGLSILLSLLEEEQFGYQMDARTPRPFVGQIPQDVLIYAYRKSGAPELPSAKRLS